MATETAVYTHGETESVLRALYWRTATNSAAYLIPALRSDMRILDIGCGPGTITADLAKLVPNGDVVGVELAGDVLEKARANAAALGVKNVQFVVGDVNGLAFPDGTFDVVHAHQVLQHVGDPVRALREMRRITKPGGIVAVRDTDFDTFTWFPDVEGMADFKEKYVHVQRANGGEPLAGRRLHAWAREAGFDPAKITKSSSTWCYGTPEERAWWGGLWADLIVSPGLTRTAISNGVATKEELEQFAAALCKWAGEEDGWFALMHGEVLCRV
ncbi:Uncharacterized methyltransferase [Sparassis crispa]|uniref:Uncharacterized methyltransferase n=1 Tax=Sparassis crispa TaxID=139825 RepID=A0A401GKK1_9APHY|nr:Uncharacterized methyltransferase [Sparassis crispa]GBE82698.1 Uncharacterized methyltransferase [Sparassis crispa]